MRRYVLAGLVTVAVAAVAHGEVSDPQKAAELAARGTTSWTPGQGRGTGPVFATVPAKPAPAGRTNNTATMQYDNGSLTALPTVFGQIYGNRFAQGAGGVALNAATLNSFSFYFMEDSLPDTGLFFQVAAAVNTMSINAAASTNITGLMNSGPSFSMPALNVIDASQLGAGTMFNNTLYLGGWCLNSATMFPINNEVIGLATNAFGGTMGPEFRGYTAVSGTGNVAFTNQPFQAILRANVTSASTVPVELMSFDVN